MQAGLTIIRHANGFRPVMRAYSSPHTGERQRNQLTFKDKPTH